MPRRFAHAPRTAVIGALGLVLGCGGAEGEAEGPPPPPQAELEAVMASVDAAGGAPGVPLGAPLSKFGLLDTPTVLYLEGGGRLQMYTKPRAPLTLGTHKLAVALGFDRQEALRRVEARSRTLSAAACDEVREAVVALYGAADPEGAAYRWRGAKIFVRWSYAEENRQPTCLVTWDLVAP
ncbi:MAG: hypothetical protein JNM72_23510 [Deltaproteobacteria bacterium]|nr:hypothetical protein [Deltaproteobacteria bacterium]